MYHAKALHLSSVFLPKDCPLVQHITQSYNKNYLKDKKPHTLEALLADLGIEIEEPEAPEVKLADQNPAAGAEKRGL